MVPSREAQAPARRPWIAVAITLAGVAVLAVIVLAIEPLRTGLSDAVRGDTGELRHDLRGLGVPGALIVIALALAHCFIWYPTEILNAATGFVYDFWIALPLLMAGWILNGIICYLIGAHAARPFLSRWLGERFDRYERMVHRGGVTLLLGMRLVPIIPFSLFSYAAGSAHVPFPRYVWTTAVGYLPLTAVFAYFGTQLDSLSADDPWLWAGVAVLLLLLLLTRRLAKAMGLGSKAEPTP